MDTHKLFVLITLSLAATVAGAQVHRCKDATGKLMFSDRPCDAGQSGGQIQRQRTQAEILQEREQAYEAESRKQERRFAEQEKELAEQERRMLLQQAQPQVQPPVDDWQTRKNRENAGTSARSITNNGGRWDQQAQAERAAAHRAELRRREASQKDFTLTCMRGVCTDEFGSTYSGSGGMLMRGDGRSCNVTGNMASCH